MLLRGDEYRKNRRKQEMEKKIVILMLVFAFIVSACGAGNPAEASPTNTPPAINSAEEEVFMPAADERVNQVPLEAEIGDADEYVPGCGTMAETTFTDAKAAGVETLGLYGNHKSGGITYWGTPEADQKFFLQPHHVVVVLLKESDDWIRPIGGQNISYMDAPFQMTMTISSILDVTNKTGGSSYTPSQIVGLIFFQEDYDENCGGKAIWEYTTSQVLKAHGYLQRGWWYFNLKVEEEIEVIFNLTGWSQ